MSALVAIDDALLCIRLALLATVHELVAMDEALFCMKLLLLATVHELVSILLIRLIHIYVSFSLYNYIA